MENLDEISRLRISIRENLLKSSIHIKKDYDAWLLMKIGLSPTEASIFIELLKSPATPVEISEKLKITLNDASTLLKRIWNKGFVTRKREVKTYRYKVMDVEEIANVTEGVYDEVGEILKNELRKLK